MALRAFTSPQTAISLSDPYLTFTRFLHCAELGSSKALPTTRWLAEKAPLCQGSASQPATTISEANSPKIAKRDFNTDPTPPNPDTFALNLLCLRKKKIPNSGLQMLQISAHNPMPLAFPSCLAWAVPPPHPAPGPAPCGGGDFP
jgi:hypothetical protein